MKRILLRSKMLINNIPPQGLLRDWVRFYRIIHFEFASNEAALPTTKAYRPRVEQCLQLTPFDNESITYSGKDIISKKIALVGQHTVLNHRHVGRNYLNFQIVFQPGALCRLLRISAEELTNVYTDARDYLGPQIDLVNERLFYCKSYTEMIDSIERYLLDLFRHKKLHVHPTQSIARHMLNPYKLGTIAWYTRQANLSQRQFSRMFKVYTGISPKEYTSLVRLDLAYLIKNRTPQKDWLTIALESGFTDYQHLSKDYKKYTGYAPTSFFELEQRAPERHFGDFEK